MDKIISIGIIGPGKIAPRFVGGAAFVDNVSIDAVYGRSFEKAKRFAKQHNISTVYETLEAFLADPSIDLVYIATPVVVHKEQIMACLHAKKHVLCEKPMLVTESEVNDAYALAKAQDVLLMEAQKAPFLQSTQWVKEAIKKGTIGDVSYIEASYGFRSSFSKLHWAYDANGGGSLWVLGVYPIAFFLSVLSDDDIVSYSRKIQLLKQGSDAFGNLQVQTESGIVGSLSSSLIADQINSARVYGSEGMIIVDHYWKSTSLRLISYSGDIETLHFDDPSDFTPYIQHAVERIEKGLTQSPIYNQYHSLKQVQLITST